MLCAAIGDAMLVAAGPLWAGFGTVLGQHRLDPVLATAGISFSALMTCVPAYLLSPRPWPSAWCSNCRLNWLRSTAAS